MEEKLSITELGEVLGVHINTIRQWEKQFSIVVPRYKDKHRSRYYTEKEIGIFRKIKELRDENVSIDNIRRFLDKDIETFEQEETALEVLPFSEISVTDIREMLANVILKREEEIKEEFENKLMLVQQEYEKNLNEKLEHNKNEILEENKMLKNALDKINDEMRSEIRQQEVKIREQIKTENNRLMEYIAIGREESKNGKKGFFQRLFGK